MEKTTFQSKDILRKSNTMPATTRKSLSYKAEKKKLMFFFLNDKNTKFETYIDEDRQKNATYFNEDSNNFNKKMERYCDIVENEVADQFKNWQENIMKEEVPVMTRLLKETMFDDGYESVAEKYFNEMFEKYGIIADTTLLNIYLENMYGNKHILKHLLFIVSNLSKERRKNLEIIPLAGMSNPDIEIQDLSVKCFEAWEDRRHIPTLKNLSDKTSVAWFKDYIDDVIEALEEG